MKFLIYFIISILSISSFARTDFNAEGSKSYQILNGKIIAEGDFCEIEDEDDYVIFAHNAISPDMNTMNIILEMDLSTARFDNGKYIVSIENSGVNYCGRKRSTKDLEFSIERNEEDIIYTISYRCSMTINRTIHQHMCKTN